MTHNCYATVSLGVSLYDSADVLQVTWQRLYEDNSIENLATYNKRFGEQVNNPYVGKIVFTEASLRSTSITVKNLTWTDESCYVCSFNAYPQGSKRHQTCLKVRGKRMTHNCYATVSLGVSLYDSADVLQVTWQPTYNQRFGEQVNNPYVGKIVFTEASLRSTSITVKNLTWTDESCYVCSFNAYPQGSKRHQTCLKVRVKTQVYAPIDDPKEENMKVIFSCTATGKPAPKIQWEYHHASVVEQSETPVLTNDDHTLTSSRNITLQASLDWDGHVDCVINPGTRGEKRETIIFTRKTEQTENGRSIFIYHSLTVFFLALVKTCG
uniref:Ig-like domain-containing protein n=1 Tax=Neogobius melanostomus TaxID=47308 RepID=A0A8C6UHP4_9GOBI